MTAKRHVHSAELEWLMCLFCFLFSVEYSVLLAFGFIFQFCAVYEVTLSLLVAQASEKYSLLCVCFMICFFLIFSNCA